MRLNARLYFLAALFVSCLVPGIFAAEDQNISFPGSTYPLQMSYQANGKVGATLFETKYSAEAEESYDTVLVQGELPDPSVRLELAVKSGSFMSPDARYGYSQMARFADGRFWAKYLLRSASRRPLKFIVIGTGSKADSTIIIYEAETLREGVTTQDEVPVSSFVYVPDPSLSVPESAPFGITRRDGWSAAPPKEPFSTHTPVYFTLHHTQGRYPVDYAASLKEVQFIQHFHQYGRNWNDIGYHFMVDPYGNIFEGRPVGVIGAHVRNRNTGNAGISILGNYHPPVSNAFTPESRSSFLAVAGYLRETYSVNRSSFYAHQDLQATDCPGDDLYALMEPLRELIFGPAVPAPIPPVAIPGEITPPADSRSFRQLMNFIR